MVTHTGPTTTPGTAPWGSPQTVVSCSCGTQATVPDSDAAAVTMAVAEIAEHIAYPSGRPVPANHFNAAWASPAAYGSLWASPAAYANAWT